MYNMRDEPCRGTVWHTDQQHSVTPLARINTIIPHILLQCREEVSEMLVTIYLFVVIFLPLMILVEVETERKLPMPPPPPPPPKEVEEKEVKPPPPRLPMVVI